MLKKSKKKLKILTLGLALALPLSFIGGISGLSYAAETYNVDCSNPIAVSNGSFNNSSSDSHGDNLGNWNKIMPSYGSGEGWIIDVGDTFSQKSSEYYLTNPPTPAGSDNKMLMINSVKSLKDKEAGKTAQIGYASDPIKLEANSYYRLSVSAMTTLDGVDTGDLYAEASIYLEGLLDNNGNKIENLGFENIHDSSFKAYYFLIATGNQQQSVNLELYLGSRVLPSAGVALFDEVTLTKYSENTFYSQATATYGYKFEDVLGTDAQQTKFIIDATLDKNPTESVLGKDYNKNYNFDFEGGIDDTSDMLGEDIGKGWKTTNSQNGKAAIKDVSRNTNTREFFNTTGFDFVGNDLSFDYETQKENSKALVLWANDGYVSAQSRDIDIKAHGIYKFTVKAKVSSNFTGSFNITFQENDSIYNNYNISKDSYTLLSGSRAGFASNSSDEYNNGYTTLTFYVKGHDYYDSSINLLVQLGDESNVAKGLVVIDNIKVEYADYETFNSASSSEKLELKAYTGNQELNGEFNLTQNAENSLSYPLAAQEWETAQDSSNLDYLKSGVLYLNPRNEKQNELYWDTLGITPPLNPDKTSPNNIYMMQNRVPSYQSIISSSYSLSTTNHYNLLSFKYLTSSTGDSAPASMTVEILNDNNMRIFYQEGIQNESASFQDFKVALQTSDISAGSIKIKISLGTEKTPAQGLLYIDKVKFTSSETASDCANQVDLSSFYLDLNGSDGYFYTDNGAYTFENSISNAASGGIVNGKKNGLGVYTADGTNMLGLETSTNTDVSLTSKFTFDLNKDGTEGTYYKLTFLLYTNFARKADADSPSDHDCKYGVTIGFDEFNLIEGLTSQGKFTPIQIYYKTDSSVNTKFVFKLISNCGGDCEDVTGLAFISNISVSNSTEDEYRDATQLENAYIATEAPKAPETSDDEDESTDSTTNNENDMRWLTISSIVFGLSILIALVAFAFSRIKFKKKPDNKYHPEEYARRDVNKDAILSKAQQLRDEEAQEIREQIDATLARRNELEAQHKESVRLAREKSNKITKEDEREFKSYANRIARLHEKEEILKEQLDLTMSAEYLINIEARLTQEEQRKLKEQQREDRQKSKNDNN